MSEKKLQKLAERLSNIFAGSGVSVQRFFQELSRLEVWVLARINEFARTVNVMGQRSALAGEITTHLGLKVV